MLFSLISQTCNCAPTLFPSLWPEASSSGEQQYLCSSGARGSQPKRGTASQGFSLVLGGRGWGTSRWENCCFFSILLHSEYAFSSFPPPSAQLSRLQLSPPVRPSNGKAKALCTGELHPHHGLGWTMEQLCSSCIAVSLLYVWWSGLSLSCKHLTGPLPIQACLVPRRMGVLQVPHSDSLKVTHLHNKEVYP